MGDRHHRLLVAPMAHHSAVAGAESTVLGPDRGQGDFDQGDAEPAVALSRRSRLVLTRALVVARAQPGPARQMVFTREPAHVHADLRDDDFGRTRLDPGD